MNPGDEKVYLLPSRLLSELLHQHVNGASDFSNVLFIVILEHKGAVKFIGLIGWIRPFSVLQPLVHKSLVKKARRFLG